MQIHVDSCKQEIPSFTETFVVHNTSSNTYLFHFVGNTCWGKMLLLVCKETEYSNHQAVVSTSDTYKNGQEFQQIETNEAPSACSAFYPEV